MKHILITALVAAHLFSGPAQAKDVSTVWTTIQESAPRSPFDQLQNTAPRSIFDQIRDSAPLSAGERDLVGELQPLFETLRDSAP